RPEPSTASRAVVSRCSNVKPKLLDYLVGNGLMLPGFADTPAFDATLANLGFGPQLRPSCNRCAPRAARLVLCVTSLEPSGGLRRGACAEPDDCTRGDQAAANGMARLLFCRLPVRRKPARHEVARERFPRLKPLDHLA